MPSGRRNIQSSSNEIKGNGKDTAHFLGEEHADHMQLLLDGIRNHLKLFFVKIIFLLIGVGAAEYDLVLVHTSISCSVSILSRTICLSLIHI